MLAELPKYIRVHTERRAETGGVVPNALYEALLIHARAIDTFLQNGDAKRSMTAKQYVENWQPQSSAPAWRNDTNWRVAHLDKHRTAPTAENGLNIDPATLVAEIGTHLTQFYDALPVEKKEWFRVIPDHFPTTGVRANDDAKSIAKHQMMFDNSHCE